MKEEIMTAAQTILKQLGGSKFVAMTGSKNFTGDGNTLTMKLARNSSSANCLKITLNARDAYDMEFSRITEPKYNVLTGESKKGKITVVKKLNDVYSDRLRSVFESVTALRVSL